MRDFYHTMDLLIQAYKEGHLENASCAACAVGNIVASCNGIKLIRSGKSYAYLGKNEYNWYYALKNLSLDLAKGIDKKLGFSLMKKTGYSTTELNEVENAFEARDFCYSNKGTVKDGLKRVLNKLIEIHNVEPACQLKYRKIVDELKSEDGGN